MNGSAMRAAGGAARRWRMRPWPNDATVAHLIPIDHLAVPSQAELHDVLDRARARGARAVRTAALFHRAADVAVSVGFETIDTLALLRLSLDDVPPFDVPSAFPPVTTMRRWHHRSASIVDQQAFGPMWGNDVASLADIRRATPHHVSRCVLSEGELVGFVIAGAAGGVGYVQRLAVAPDHRRGGIGTALVIDALRWMQRRRLGSVLVNTGVHNDAALRLYDRLGFCRMTEHLTIVEYRFDS